MRVVASLQLHADGVDVIDNLARCLLNLGIAKHRDLFARCSHTLMILVKAESDTFVSQAELGVFG